MLVQVLAQRANLVGAADYNQYHKRCTRKIHKLRKQEGIITRPSKSASPRPKAGSAEILVWQSERCWAESMELRSALETRAARGMRTRSLKKLSKSSKFAAAAAEQDPSSLDIQTLAALARADFYAARNSWNLPRHAYSEARLALESYQNPITSEYIQTHVDPALKLAIANTDGSSLDTATFSRQTAKNSAIATLVTAEHPGLVAQAELESPSKLLGPIEFGTYSAQVNDADLAQQLLITRTKDSELDPTDAEQFDAVMQHWATSCDMTRDLLAGIDDPENELYVVNTWVNYNLITRRIQRDDLASAAVEPKAGVHLVNNILQSCVELAELPGVYADEMRGQSIDAMTAYFKSRRCGLLARAYAQADKDLEALALISRASKLIEGDIVVHDLPVTQHTLNEWRSNIELDLKRAHGSALIHLNGSHAPVAENMSVFRSGPAADVLSNIIDTSRIRLIPVKPVFYDLAYTYVNYPQGAGVKEEPVSVPKQEAPTPEPKKKGLFGLFKST